MASPSLELYITFLNAIGYTSKKEDQANKLLSMKTQLGWFREIEFVDVN